MSKGEDFKVVKFQTCDLRVNIYCDGCRLKVKKLLHRIQGVFQVAIGLDDQKVTVVGTVDPSILIDKLARAGKHAELWSPKANPSPKPKNGDYDIDDCFHREDYDAAETQFRASLDLLRRRAIEANNAKKHHAMARIQPGPGTRNGHSINNRPGKGKKIDTNQPMAIYNTPSRIEPKRVNVAGFNVGNFLNSTDTSRGGLHLQQNNNGNGYPPSSTSGFATETSQYYQLQSTFINDYNNQYYECNDPDFSFLVLIVIFIFIAFFVLKF